MPVPVLVSRRPRLMVGLVSVLALLGLGVGALAPSPAVASASSTRDYLVVGPGVAAIRTAVLAQGGRVQQSFANINMVAARMSDTAARTLDARPDLIAEQVMQFYPDGDRSPTRSYGIDRLDQRTAIDPNQTTRYTFPDAQDGTGVDAYIIDSGLRTSHQEFTGRVSTSQYYDPALGTVEDCMGHGTHVSGTVAGATVGVAPGATIVPVRVFNCSGSVSGTTLAAAVNWVVGNHQAGKPAVANMSLGGGASSTLDSMVDSMVADGIVVTVAAGNSNADACGTSPARAPSAITVGASTYADARSSFSNYGSCLDLFAPGGAGVSSYTGAIISAYYTGDNVYAYMSGTSMAAPHAAGAAARYLEAFPAATPSQVATALSDSATTGALSSIGTGSPNRLLYLDPVGFPAGGGSTILTAPAAPGGASAAANLASGLNVTWSAPSADASAAPITGYTLSAFVSGSSTAARTVTAGADATTTTITGLTAGTAYTVRIAATSSVGTGAVATTPAVTVTAPATVVRLLSASYPAANQTVVKWSAPSNLGGLPLVRYEYRLSTDSTCSSYGTWTTTGTALTVTLTGIAKGVTRCVEVRAVTNTAMSPVTGAVARTTVKPTK